MGSGLQLKLDTLGYLIYLAMALHLGAFLLLLIAGLGKTARKRLRGAGQIFYFLGFATVVTAISYHWLQVERIPLKNLFEVFLVMALIWPFSLLGRRIFRVGAEAGDALIAVIVLFPAGFVFDVEKSPLMPALQSRLFLPHVMSYMISYIILGKATVQALAQLVRPRGPADASLISYEEGTYRMVRLGFPLLTLGLILGSWWGKRAWGDYWNWDPKEMWSLASWLIFLVYFHWRWLFGRKYPRLNSLWVILGMLAIIITLIWVNLSRLFPGMHSYAS